MPVLSAAGGTETWHKTLLSGIDRSRILPVGIAVESAPDCDDGMARRFVSEGLIPRVRAGSGAMDKIGRDCEVVVAWGISRAPDCLEEDDRPAVVMVSHGDTGFSYTTRMLATAEPWVDHYAAVSPAALEAVPEDRRAAAAIIPNGIDSLRLANPSAADEQRERWRIHHSAMVLGMVCRVSEEKNCKALARTLEFLPPEWTGVLIGDGPELLDVMADSYGRGGRVVFPGRMDDVGSAYRAMDCLLSASHTEGFGLAAIEAMACGIPVVCTPVGILRDDPCHAEIVSVNASGSEWAMAVRTAAATWSPFRKRATLIQSTIEKFSAKTFCQNWTNYLLNLPARHPCSTPALPSSTSP